MQNTQAVLLAIGLFVAPAKGLSVKRLRLRSSSIFSRGLVSSWLFFSVTVSSTVTVTCFSGWLLGAVLLCLLLVFRWFFRFYLRKKSATKFVRDPLAWAATWDLLAACLRSGLPVPIAVRSVAKGAPQPGASLLTSAAALLALGADPASAWASAYDCPDTEEFARVAIRTARSGIALADGSMELAKQIRENLSDEAEAKAQSASVLIAGPLALCFLPAFICIGIVPIVIGLIGRLNFLS